MKYVSLILLIFYSSILVAQAPEDRSDTIDVIKYGIYLYVDQTNKTLSGSCQIELKSKMDNIGNLSFDLEKMTIDSIVSNNQSLSYAYDSVLLRVDLGGTILMKNDSMSLKIYYKGSPIKDNSGWGGWYWSGDYAYNLGVAFEDDPHNYGRIWHPCFDNFVERALYSIDIETDSGKVGSSVGLLQGNTNLINGHTTWHWESEIPIPSYLACIHVADYSTIKWTYNGSERDIPVELYAKAQDTAAFKIAFQNLDKNLEAFEHFYGPYQFEKVGYSLVPFNGGAMEHSTNISYPVSAATNGLAFETLMAHELAHHWWGNWVTCDKKEEMWLNEGMASYSEYLFLEYMYGKENSRDAIKDLLAETVQKGHVNDKAYRAIQGIPHEYTYSTHVYSKGALVAHTLRNYLGDSIYFPAVKQFMLDSALRGMNSAGLQAFLEDYSSKDLSHFFNPWVFSEGYPDFNITFWNTTETINSQGNHTCNVRIIQRLNHAPEYYNDVPLTISFYNNDWQRVDKKVFMSGPCADFDVELPFKAVIAVLNVDQNIADACVRDSVVLKDNGFINFAKQHIKIKIDAISDSALLFVEHHYAPAEPLITAIPNLHLSQYRFWKIHGDLKGSIEGYYDFTFDGGNTANSAHLDDQLISNSEDSLVLLYRVDGQSDWAILADASLYNQGSSGDKKGRIRYESIKLGEYVLGIYDVQKLDSNIIIPSVCPNLSGVLKKKVSNNQIVIYPNPTSNMLTLEYKGENRLTNVRLYNASGILIKTYNAVGNNKFQINTTPLPNGIYYLGGQVDLQKFKKSFIVEH